MELNENETARAEDSEADEAAVNSEAPESSEEDKVNESGVPSSPHDAKLSAEEERQMHNDAVLPAVENGSIGSTHTSAGSSFDRESVPAFVSARSLVQDNLLRQEVFLSPGFRSAAAMAGWDDEALLLASEEGDPCLNLVVQEDQQAMAEARSPAFFEKSPQMDLIRETREKKREERTPQLAATPASAGRRHRRARRQAIHECSPEALPIGDLSLKEEFQEAVSQPPKEEISEAASRDQRQQEATSSETGHSTALKAETMNQKPACLDQLREELSCAICLDICFEPSTTSCGHSFCRGCMESVLQKCGPRCPKCRQQLKGDTWRSCPVNIVLWNTVQLLFPAEVAVRREAADVAAVAKSEVLCKVEGNRQTAIRRPTELASMRRSTWQHARPPSSGLRRRGGGHRVTMTYPSSEEEHSRSTGTVERQLNMVSVDVMRERQVLADAAFARHLQMQLMSSSAGVNSNRRSGSSPTNLASAAANLRAMANRAVRHRSRH